MKTRSPTALIAVFCVLPFNAGGELVRCAAPFVLGAQQPRLPTIEDALVTKSASLSARASERRSKLLNVMFEPHNAFYTFDPKRRIFFPTQVVPPESMKDWTRDLAARDQIDTPSLGADQRKIIDEHVRVCNGSAKGFSTARDNLFKTIPQLHYIPIDQWLANNNPSKNQLQAIEAFRAGAATYETNCLSATIDSHFLSVGIEKVVGAIGKESGGFCTGLRITNNIVVTARHCFYFPRTNEWNTQIAPNDVWFQYLGDSTDRYQVCSIVAGEHYRTEHPSLPIATRDDYVFLAIAGVHQRPPQITKHNDALTPYAPLYLVGLFPDMDFLYPGGKVQNFRSTKHGGCYVGKYDSPACVFHGCQALSGTSGAPIFFGDARNGLKLVGFHIGTPASVLKGRETCTSNRFTGGANLGLYAPDELSPAIVP